MRDWHSYTGSHSKCRYNQLVCSLNRRCFHWHRDKLHNTEYKCDHNILCRCDRWWVYNSHEDSCNRNSQYNPDDNRNDPRIKMRNRNCYTGRYSKCRYDQLVRSRFGRHLSLEQVQATQLPSISTTTTYYVDATDGGCTTASKDSSNSNC